MAIPVYLVSAHGGDIVQMDDLSVVKDLAAAAGTGGNSFTARFLSSLFDGGNAFGYSTFRRWTQHLHHSGAVTAVMTPWRDENDTGQDITRTLTSSSAPILTAPFKAGGTEFQVEIVLSAFDAECGLGEGAFEIVPRRGER